MPSDEYPFTMVLVIFVGFLHYFVMAKLASSSIGIKSRNLAASALYSITACAGTAPGQYKSNHKHISHNNTLRLSTLVDKSDYFDNNLNI